MASATALAFCFWTASLGVVIRMTSPFLPLTNACKPIRFNRLRTLSVTNGDGEGSHHPSPVFLERCENKHVSCRGLQKT